MIEKLFEGCENLGWSVSEDQEAGTVELESYSPAGENLVVTVEKENFSEKVREYAEDFDIDEHIEMWVEARNNATGSRRERDDCTMLWLCVQTGRVSQRMRTVHQMEERT